MEKYIRIRFRQMRNRKSGKNQNGRVYCARFSVIYGTNLFNDKKGAAVCQWITETLLVNW